MTTNQKIQQLRSIMKREHIAAVIIPSNDPHQSEYVADCWKGREWISGFTGSAGTVVVATDHAGLWTDSRYYQSAKSGPTSQLGPQRLYLSLTLLMLERKEVVSSAV